MDRSEDSQENLLRKVQCLLAVAKQVERQLDDHPLMLCNQLNVRALIAGRATRHERCLPSVYLRPSDDARLFQGEVPGRNGHLWVTPSTITNLDSNSGWKFQSSHVLLRYRSRVRPVGPGGVRPSRPDKTREVSSVETVNRPFPDR